MTQDPGEVFTTGEAAQICHVSQQTIIRCFDNGTLKGFRVPGSKFRRIPLWALYRFMVECNIPTDRFEARLGTRRRVVVGSKEPLDGLEIKDVEIGLSDSAFGLSLALADFMVRAVVLDDTLDDLPELEQVAARCFSRKLDKGESYEPWFPIPERLFEPALLKWRVVVCIGRKPNSKHRVIEEVKERLILLPKGTTLQTAIERALEHLAA